MVDEQKQHVRTLSATEILQTIFRYLTEVSKERDYGEVIRLLAEMGKALTSSDRCTVWVVNENRTEIWTQIAQGLNGELRIPIDSGIVGSAIVSEESVVIDDVYKDSRFNSEVDKKTGYKTKSMMVIPMYDHDDEIIGAFQVINHQGEKGIFDKRDLERLALASTYAAETLASAKLTKEIEETQREVVFTMGAIGESRSKETGNHVKRVAQYSKILALAYGMSESEAEMLKQASPMHDIGKIAIPDAILNKPGRFNPEERSIMDTHAELGFNMIKNSDRPLLKAAAIVAYEHHEKWNGKGYPQGTSGEDIHIYGRITAIADVFDALGSDRVYKKAWSDEKILNLFREERGEHFDPNLIDMFFENIDDIMAVREEFSDKYKDVKQTKEATKNCVEVLGAHGTKAPGYGTSAFWLNDKNVIDAGNLLGPLKEASIDIENIWLTHSHLDHISDIAYILDNYFSERTKTLNIIGLPETLKAIKENLLNNSIWPDFSKIPLVKAKVMAIKYMEIEIGKEYGLGGDEFVEAFETDHTVASCGYIYKKGDQSILITADTLDMTNVFKIIESRKDINSVVFECSFPSSMRDLAIASKHLTPQLLFDAMKNLKRDDFNFYINHIKPSFINTVTKEIEQMSGKWNPVILKDEDIINF